MKFIYTVVLFWGVTLSASAATTLKVGVLAPDGSNWAIVLKQMAAEIKSATGGDVAMKFYFGGSQGDESDVLKKMRVGQLHGGIFTGKTLGDIHGDARVLELPFTFYHDRQKAGKALKHLSNHLGRQIEKKKLKNLGLFGMGMVYFVSKKKVSNLDDLKGVKIWYWEGDKVSASMIDILNLVAVPIPLPDVLNSLQTGILEAAYAPPLGIVALQWDSKINYVLDFPLAFAVGAFLLSQRGYKRIKPAHRAAVEKVVAKYMEKIDQANAKDNRDAIALMKQKGVEFVKFPLSDQQKGKEIRKKIVEKLKDKVFSEASLKLLNQTL